MLQSPNIQKNPSPSRKQAQPQSKPLARPYVPSSVPKNDGIKVRERDDLGDSSNEDDSGDEINGRDESDYVDNKQAKLLKSQQRMKTSAKEDWNYLKQTLNSASKDSKKKK